MNIKSNRLTRSVAGNVIRKSTRDENGADSRRGCFECAIPHSATKDRKSDFSTRARQFVNLPSATA